MAQIMKKADGWEVLDENGRHVFDTESEARAYMSGTPTPADEEEVEE